MLLVQTPAIRQYTERILTIYNKGVSFNEKISPQKQAFGILKIYKCREKLRKEYKEYEWEPQERVFFYPSICLVLKMLQLYKEQRQYEKIATTT